MIEKSQGIVLNSIKYGDSSKIVTVFTKDFGKIAFIAKGARAAKSKFGASLELLTVSEFTFYNKLSIDLLLLSNSDIIKSNIKLTKDSNILLVGLMIAEVINNTQEKRSINHELFDFSQNLIFQLSDYQFNPFSIFNIFMNGLSSMMGFGLIWDNYQSNNNDAAISLENGSIIYDKYMNKNIYKFSNEEINYFYNLINSEIVNDFEFNKKAIIHFYDFWVQYFSFHLERKFVLKSAALL